MKILLDCLEDFGNRSGLKMNPIKSSIYCAGVEDLVIQDIQRAAHILKGEMPFRYLGIPLAAEKVKVMHYSPLIDKIVDLMKGWRGETLSYAGRCELINSVVHGIYSFWCGMFPIPCSVRNMITKLCRDYFWGGRGAVVSWESLARPKSEGGVGFKDLEAWNLALLSKVVWNICAKKDSLWIRWVSHVYMKGVEFWEWKVHKRDSSLFKTLFNIKEKILAASSRAQAEVILEGWFGSRGLKGGAYDFFRSKGEVKTWYRAVWCHQTVPKHSFVLWLATLGRLKTKERIKPTLDDISCTFCGHHAESSVHLFFACPTSSRIWHRVKKELGIRRLCSTLEMALKWLKKEARGSSWKAKAKRIGLAATVYFIWLARNRKHFEGEVPNEQQIVRDIMTSVYGSLYAHYPHLLECGDQINDMALHGLV